MKFLNAGVLNPNRINDCEREVGERTGHHVFSRKPPNPGDFIPGMPPASVSDHEAWPFSCDPELKGNRHALRILSHQQIEVGTLLVNLLGRPMDGVRSFATSSSNESCG